MEHQTSATVLMVRPSSFAFHADAARSNAFAANDARGDVAGAAIREFDALHAALEAAGVTCIVLEDDPSPPRPDAVFPNNWVSFHADGTVVVYPMANSARRLERRPELLVDALRAHGFDVRHRIDLSSLELGGSFLEGTGSLVLDRPTRQAFAARSVRTDDRAIAAFDEALGYSTFVFDAVDRAGDPIYHTNVLLSLGRRFALLCVEAIVPADRERVRKAIVDGGRAIVEISVTQMENFACNAIELADRAGQPLVALSSRALASLDPAQRACLEELGGQLVAADIPTIERVGGGSVRCMLADVHLPRVGQRD